MHSEIQQSEIDARFDADFQYYIDNQDELVKIYNGYYLIIKDKEVRNKFTTLLEAYEWGNANFEPGTFVIQLCTPGPDAYTRNAYSQSLYF